MARPHTVDNVVPVGEVEGVKIDQIVVGSCTNGRLDDLEVVAAVLRGKKVAKATRMLVFPASWRIWKEAMRQGRDRRPGGGRCCDHELGVWLLPGYPPGGAGRRRGGAGHYQPELQRAHGQPQCVGVSGVAG